MKKIFKDKRLWVIVAIFSACAIVFGISSYAGSSTQKKINAIVTSAASKKGSTYVLGAEGDSTFDCSGLVYWAYQTENNVKLASKRATADDYASAGKHIERKDLKKGDLVFFEKDSNGKINHIGIYIGSGKFIHASQSYGKVLVSRFSDHLANPETHKADKEKPTYSQIYVGARRVVGVKGTATPETVKEGDSGTTVRTLQKDLKSLGYKVTADGDFGPKTKAAVISFQKKYGLAADGIVGPKTWEMIREVKAERKVIIMC